MLFHIIVNCYYYLIKFHDVSNSGNVSVMFFKSRGPEAKLALTKMNVKVEVGTDRLVGIARGSN